MNRVPLVDDEPRLLTDLVLPSSPGVVQDLHAALESRHCDARTLAGVLERDVALSAKVLQLANSSSAPGARITSLEAAVGRLGVQTIRSLVRRGGVVRVLDILDGPARHRLELLDRHALETARLARRLAPPRLADDAFCAGLLHECGQLVLASLPDIERTTFGNDHAQAGACLLSLWGFPPEVVDAVSTHALPIDGDPPLRMSLSALVRLAHHLVEAELARICDAPESTVDDTWLRETGLHIAVWSWRAEHVLRQASEPGPGEHPPAG